jgi:type IV pilus biogenesis protein PilP
MPVKAGDFAVFENKGVVAVRDDPFSLLPSEKSYEHEQTAQNLAAMTGHFPMFYEAPPEIDTTPEVEPQPYRRLAGIIIGDSVTALIDLGNGQIMEIHPGQRIPGTEWQVLSIDSEKAVLRRVGSRKLPSEVVVRLESPPPGAQPAPSGNPTNNAPANNGPLNSPTPGTGGARGD